MEEIRMDNAELVRLAIIQKIYNKFLTQKKAAQELNLSVRQIKRLYRRFKAEGPKGLLSHKKGLSHHCLSDQTKKNALEIIRNQYMDFGPTLAHEKLTEIHGFNLSLWSVRNIMIKNDIWCVDVIKKAIVHQMRARRSKVGELVQIDGSPHDWFEGRGSKCTLLVFIDDATSAIMEAEFVEAETTWNYMELTQRYILKHGRPLAFYSDKHSIFRINKTDALSGNGLTQFGRALKELEIELICANSPQAKGRVERANRTLQDRLVKELRLHKISSIEEANVFLPSFIADYNLRFAKVSKDTNNAHRSVPKEMDLKRIFVLKETRYLSKNLTLQYNNTIYQIRTIRPSYALRKAKVLILENRQREVTVEYNGKKLDYTRYEERPYQVEVIPYKMLNSRIDELMTRHKKHKPSKHHPWRSNFLGR